MKKIYFLSDAHLGSRAMTNNPERERKLCAFLDSVRCDASAIYLLGDIFDFWFEYHNVIPKGYTRFLGKLSELTDIGIEIHYFTGNHDMWAFSYLHEECGVILHTAPTEIILPSVSDKNVCAYVGHGDGLGDPSRGFRFIRAIFHSSLCQWLFRNIFPADLGMEFGLRWAKSSRLKHSRNTIAENGDTLFVSESGELSNALGDVLSHNTETEEPFQGEGKEPLVIFSKQYIKEHPGTSFLIFGHRHIEFDLMLSRQCRLLILGEWLRKCTYAVWDGETMLLDNYED